MESKNDKKGDISMKTKIMPTSYFMFLLILSIGSHFIYPVRKYIHPPVTYVGIIFMLFGVVFNLWADTLFKKVQTPVKPHLKPIALETSGPFRMADIPCI